MRFRLDGIENCLWWSDSQMEIAYTLPTERSAAHHIQFMTESAKEDALSNAALKTQQQTPRKFTYFLELQWLRKIMPQNLTAS
jgi:hypothetical protein